jgi:hypothetical protein
MKKVTNSKTSKLEKFIKNFCKERGWNAKELTTGQMLFISNQLEYQKIIKNG